MTLYRFISVCIGIVIAIFLGEILMRIYYCKVTGDNTLVLNNNAILVYGHKPGIKFTNKYNINIKYNSLGFIGEEVDEKGADVFRILGVGDSVTAAGYLSEDERYLNRIVALLSERAGSHIEVINAGVGGYNTWQELELIRDKGLYVKPDLIIVGICLNDVVYKKPRLKKKRFGGIAENYRGGSKARYFDFIYQRSDLYKFLYDFLSKMRLGLYSEAGYRRYVERYDFDIKPKDFERWKKTFLDMVSLTKTHNIEILFVIFPLESQMTKEVHKSYGELSNFFEEIGVYHIDLMTDFKREAIRGGPLFRKRDIIHPTSLGHRIAAEAIVNYIIDNRILE